jgi:5,10-methylenetetrahydromethanopterin reductase
MKLSAVCLPEYPIEETLSFVKKADEVGLDSFWFVDEVYHKDAWLIMAVASRNTKRIRIGPAVTHVYLRDPALIAQMLATMDELSNGRAVAAISIGNLIMLQQFHVRWQGTEPLQRVKEAFEAIRMLLNKGALTYEGRHFKYTGIFTSARPTSKIPLYLGAMGGPRSFRMAGEISDGVMAALGYSYDFWKDVVSRVKEGTKAAGRSFDELDVAAWAVTSVSKDRDAARKAAKTIVGFYIPSMPKRQLRMHGIDPADVEEINQTFFKGDTSKVVELTTDELAEKLSLSGSPDDVIDKLEKNFGSAGVKHLAAAIIDPFLVKFYTGVTIDGLPDFKGQMEILKNEVIPGLRT